MLVIVKDRNAHPLFEFFFNIEALRRLDVFQIDPAERRLHGGNHVDQFVRVIFGQLDIEHVDPGEFLEQATLAFHDRLGGQRADVTQTKHGSTVGNHTDQIGPRRIFSGSGRVFNDRITRRSNTRRIGQRKITLVGQTFGRTNRNFAGGWPAMVFKCGFAQILFHEISLGIGHEGKPCRLLQSQSIWNGPGKENSAAQKFSPPRLTQDRRRTAPCIVQTPPCCDAILINALFRKNFLGKSSCHGAFRNKAYRPAPGRNLPKLCLLLYFSETCIWLR